ncbi:MAG: hypothetical protein R3190_10220 [Thermoanaerobaculia bacterium]|nr:hypothetical protein [Thermoanaerobaculia bacterium]
MRKHRPAVLSLVAACLLGAAASHAETIRPARSPRGKSLSPVSAKIQGKGGTLSILLETNFDIAAHLESKNAGLLAELLFDVDTSLDSGGHTLLSESWQQGGYDFLATVSACKRSGDTAVCDGSFGAGQRITEVYGEWVPARWSTAKAGFAPLAGGGRRVPIAGKTIQIDIPYSELGAEAGTKVKMTIVCGFGGARFEDFAVTLE